MRKFNSDVLKENFDELDLHVYISTIVENWNNGCVTVCEMSRIAQNAKRSVKKKKRKKKQNS